MSVQGSARVRRAWVVALLGWDQRTLRRIHSVSRPGLDPLMRFATWLGNSLTWWIHTAVVWVLAGGSSALLLGCGSGFAAIVAQAFKRSIRRRRPTVALEGFDSIILDPDRYSFPSGHTCGAVGGAVAVAFVNPTLGLVYGVMAAVIAFSRMYLGAHYPLDVLGGAVIGAISGSATAVLLLRLLAELPSQLAAMGVIG